MNSRKPIDILSIERYVMTLAERQLVLQEFLKPNHWDWDLDVRGAQLLFLDKVSHRTLAAASLQYVGSESLISNTWRWAWANADLSALEPATVAARSLCRIGVDAGLDFYRTGQSHVDDDDECLRMALLCAGISDCYSWFVCPYEGGRLYLCLEAMPAIVTPTRGIALALNTINMSIAMLPFNHRLAMLEYLGPAAESTVNQMTWRLLDGILSASFDSLDRCIESSAKTHD